MSTRVVSELPAAPGSLFAGAAVCQIAGLPVAAGVRGPVFDQDVWDFSVVVGLPAYMQESAKLLDFSVIANPLWRTVAKELVVALLAPGHEQVRTLPFAYRILRQVGTVSLRLDSLVPWFNWLTARGFVSLAQVSNRECEAYIAGRLHRRDAEGREVGTRLSAAQGEALVVIELYVYRELFSADHYEEGMVPFKGKVASEVVPIPSHNGNSTRPVADEVLQPLLAAALYMVGTLGEHIAGLLEHVRGQRERYRSLPSPKSLDRAVIIRGLKEQVAAGVPFARIRDEGVRERLEGKGFSLDDPLLSVSFSRFANRIGLRTFHHYWLGDVRDEFEWAVRAVGMAEPFGREAALVPDCSGERQIPWTAPLSELDARALSHRLRMACLIVVAAASGMRASELAELKTGCRMPPEQVGPGRSRLRLAGKVVKRQGLGGTPADWVVIEPVYQAIGIAELICEDPQDGLMAIGSKSFSFSRFRQWVNTVGCGYYGLAPIPEGQVNLKMLRRTLAIELAYRPNGLLAAKLHLKHISVVTTEGYAAQPGGAQARFLAEVGSEEQGRNITLVLEQYRRAKAGQMPAGPGARDLLSFLNSVDGKIGHLLSETPNVILHDRQVHTMVSKRAKTLHLGHANYCWFVDPSKALCLRLAGTPQADRPLIGMCDAARCPQATFDRSHRDVWAESVKQNTVFLGQIGRGQKTERSRLQGEIERAQRVVDAIDAAEFQQPLGSGEGAGDGADQ